MSALFIDNVLLFGSSLLSNCKEETMSSHTRMRLRCSTCLMANELLHTDQRHSHSHAVLFFFFFFLNKNIFADIKTSGSQSLRFPNLQNLAERFHSVFLMSLHTVSDKSGMKIKDSPSAGDDDDESSPTCFHLDSRASAEPQKKVVRVMQL